MPPRRRTSWSSVARLELAPAALMRVVGAGFIIFGVVFVTLVWPGLSSPTEEVSTTLVFAAFGFLFFCIGWIMFVPGSIAVKLAPAALGCLAALVAGAYLIALQHHRVTSYRPVPALVLAASIQSRVVKSEEGGDRTFYRPAVWYEYEVDGRTFSSGTVFPLPYSLVDAGESFQTAKEMFGRMYLAAGEDPAGDEQGRPVDRAPAKPGQPVPAGVYHLARPAAGKAYTAEAYYNPANPAEAFLVRRYSWYPYGLFLLPAAILFIAAFVVASRWQLVAKHRSGARWSVVALWHAIGALLVGHYVLVVISAPGSLGTQLLSLTAAYEFLGLVPLGVALPNEGAPGRVKVALAAGWLAALVVSLLVLLVGIFLAGVVALVSEWVFGRSINPGTWVVPLALGTGGLAALVAGGAVLIRGSK